MNVLFHNFAYTLSDKINKTILNDNNLFLYYDLNLEIIFFFNKYLKEYLKQVNDFLEKKKNIYKIKMYLTIS